MAIRQISRCLQSREQRPCSKNVMMTVPVIILNYNSSADCRKCVTYLKRQEGTELEIILVDNCSREEDAEAVRQLAEEESCTFIPAQENRGYNAGNNIGLRYAAKKGYKYALIANPDMEFPQKDYVAQLVNVMEEKPEVAACGSDILTPYGKHQNPQREATYYEELFWFYTTWRNRKSGNWFLCDCHQSGYCEKINGCCLMVRISFICNQGFFDEGVFLYSEEAILASQIKRSNYKMYYIQNAVARHQHIESQKGDNRKRLQISFESRYYYYRNYSGYSKLKLQALLLSKKFQQLVYRYFYACLS